MKTNREGAVRVRIGDPLSPVDPGDTSPEGKPYHKGQYAPTIDELATESLKQATKNNLINKNLPILNEEGMVDEDKIKGWNPNGELQGYGVTVSPNVPKHSSAVIVSSFMDMGDWLSNLGMQHIFGDEESGNQPKGMFGDIIIQAETSGAGRKFNANLRVFPKFYKYVSVPLRPSSPSKPDGVSMGSYAVMHSTGHILFGKMSFDGRLDFIGDFIDKSGWKKYADVNAYHGSYMGYKNQSVWRRDDGHKFQTEFSKYSPVDDFSEAFAMFFANPTYLKRATPEKYALMRAILKEYGAY